MELKGGIDQSEINIQVIFKSCGPFPETDNCGTPTRIIPIRFSCLRFTLGRFENFENFGPVDSSLEEWQVRSRHARQVPPPGRHGATMVMRDQIASLILARKGSVMMLT